jgi:hypothetical protein
MLSHNSYKTTTIIQFRTVVTDLVMWCDVMWCDVMWYDVMRCDVRECDVV